MPGQISTVYSRGSWGSWRYLCNVTQLGSARLDSTQGGAGGGRRQAGDGGVCPSNSCPLRIQPLCGRVAGNPYITYVDPDQDHSAPFMYETPAYNTLASERHRARRGWIRVGSWSPTVFSNYPSFRTRFSPVSANAYKYICWSRDRTPVGRLYKGLRLFDCTSNDIYRIISPNWRYSLRAINPVREVILCCRKLSLMKSYVSSDTKIAARKSINRTCVHSSTQLRNFNFFWWSIMLPSYVCREVEK